MSYLCNFGHTACLELVHIALLTQQLLEKQFNRSAFNLMAILDYIFQ